MNIDNNLLRLKEINPLQKLILGLIMETHPVVLEFDNGYNKTCGEIAKELGSSRAKILKEFERLIEMGYITSSVGYRSRKTYLTEKFESLVLPF